MGLDGKNCVVRLGYDKGIRITHLSAPGSDVSLLGSESPFVIVLSVEGEKLDASKVQIEAVEIEDMHKSQLASVVFQQKHNRHCH